MTRAFLALLISVCVFAPAAAQTPEEGQMRLYIQQLEDQVRRLTGENERLLYELNQLRVSMGQPPVTTGAQLAPAQTGTLPAGPAPAGATATAGVEFGAPVAPGAPPQDLGTISVAPDDPLIAPDGVDTGGAPIDLSTLAGGVAGELVTPVPSGTVIVAPAVPAPAGDPNQQLAGLPAAPSATTALSGSSRDEYDLAYGYILTGDYSLAEESFKTWLAAFPSDPQALDAQFWLGESHLQQGEYRDAANAFLAVYKAAPDSTKGPDALLKLGMSLSALGEKAAACGTLAELGRRYPEASESLKSRVSDEETRTGC